VVGLTAGTIAIGHEQARATAAYEQEAEARKQEAEARARAEQNFHQAQRLVDYIAEIAAVDMAAESDLPNVRRKLLQAALSYYKDFLKQQTDNQLTREELLRGQTRVATILEAIGRPKDAEVAWNHAFQLAMTIGDGDATFHLVPANSKLRLLRLASVQKDLKLSPQQVRAILELEEKRNDRSRGKQGRGEGGQASQDQASEEEVAKLLEPEQARRLAQLQVQQLGTRAFQDGAVSAALALTPEQRAAVAAIQKEAQATQRLPCKVGEAVKKAHLDRILGLLTAEQKSRWRELVGEPFAGGLPSGDLVLSMGKMTINLVPMGDRK
jgi:hypothetical protein